MIAVPLRIILCCIFEVVLRAPTKIDSDILVTDDNGKNNSKRKESIIASVIRRGSILATSLSNQIKKSMKMKNINPSSSKRMNGSIISSSLFVQSTVCLPSSIKEKRSVA